MTPFGKRSEGLENPSFPLFLLFFCLSSLNSSPNQEREENISTRECSNRKERLNENHERRMKARAGHSVPKQKILIFLRAVQPSKKRLIVQKNVQERIPGGSLLEHSQNG